MNILIDLPLEKNGLAKLQSIPGVSYEMANPIQEESRRLPDVLLEGKETLFCTSPPVNFDSLTSLKWVQISSAGHEQLLSLDLPSRGIKASNARGVFDVPIAEWCFAMMVNLFRDFRGMIRNQEQGAWDRDKRFQREIRGKVVGFWGYGGLARETARLCHQAGMGIHAMTRGPIKVHSNNYRVNGTGDPRGQLPSRVFSYQEKDVFLGGLDFLVLATPLNQSTRGMMCGEELRALPSRAYVLNPARGPLIQEEALLKALRDGWIAGAALDTHYHYPMPKDHPLWRMSNVIMTPHISGSSQSPYFLSRIWDLFIQNVERFIRGEPLLNELSRDQLVLMSDG